MQDICSISFAFPGGFRLKASQNATEKQSFCIYLALHRDNAGQMQTEGPDHNWVFPCIDANQMQVYMQAECSLYADQMQARCKLNAGCRLNASCMQAHSIHRCTVEHLM